MQTPLIIVNFKNETQRAYDLARICSEVSKEYKIKLAVAPNFKNLEQLREFEIPLFSQYFDNSYLDRVNGSLVNHSDYRLSLYQIKSCVSWLRQKKLVSVVCAENEKEAGEFAYLSPDFVAIEPRELIGTGRAVSKVKPEVILDSLHAVQKINPKIKFLCGAGLSNAEDVESAFELGVDGFLISSAVVKSKDPQAKLRELVQAIHAKSL